jgi:hypothetical protein
LAEASLQEVMLLPVWRLLATIPISPCSGHDGLIEFPT